MMSASIRNRSYLSLLSCFILLQGFAQVFFENISTQVGVVDTTKSYGIYWGDYDNNSFPDFFAPNHYNPWSAVVAQNEIAPKLFINIDGTTLDGIEAEILDIRDIHGATFFRTKESVYQNIALFTGGVNKNMYFKTPLVLGNYPDTTCAFCPSRGRSRTAMALDANLDGRTDLFVNQEASSHPLAILSALFIQQDDFTFELDTTSEFTQSTFSMQADVDNDGANELITSGDGRFRIFENFNGQLDFAYQATFAAGDISVQDFDNDGDFEMLVSQRVTRNYLNESASEIDVYLAHNFGYDELIFQAPDSFNFQVFSFLNTFGFVTGGAHQLQDIQGEHIINQNDPTVLEWPEDTLEQHYINLSYDTQLDAWRVQVNRPTNKSIRFRITAPTGLAMQGTNINTSIPEAPLHLMEFTSDGSELSVLSDIQLADVSTSSFLTEDFDNDGDQDLVVFPSHLLEGKPLYFVENANGQFDFDNATEITEYAFGSSDACASMDIDNDGRLDISRVNAGGFPGEYGSIDIYKNNTLNNNNWLKINLQGVTSNADGLGSIVFVYTGNLSQKKLMDGGYHRFAQDQQTLHFGLGTATSVDSLVIHWPSGIIQSFENLGLNTTHNINEATGIVSIDELAISDQPQIAPNPSKGVFVLHNVAELAHLEIFDQRGKKIWSEKINGVREKQINLTSMANGVYIARLNTSQGIFHYRLIKSD